MLHALKIIYTRLINRSCDIAIDAHAVNVTLEGHNAINPGAKVYNCRLGKFSYVNYNAVVANTSIGRFCSIGPGCVIGLGDHPASVIASTSPQIYRKGRFRDNDIYDGYAPVVIGNDVWIGANVTICNGVTIGDGAIVAANSVVKEIVQPYHIVGGSPAKTLRLRFTQDQIDKLTELKWWDKPEAWIKEHIQDFNNIDNLLK